MPMVVLAETVRGHELRDAAVNLLLGQFAPPRPLDEPTARAAGGLLAAANTNSTIDALVAAEALHRLPSTVLTSNPDDLRRLLDGHRGVTVEQI
ncbi:MAG TPA: hypothetical protein PK020_05470 [Ilumatobacteraceae bacterium]|nr:hypothetical protein [Ilumatobacteraceae bacterium]HRB04225.1 hypothetical protein [Ilumatobacteraceae bacterium]